MTYALDECMDKMNILRIQSWESIYRFEESLVPYTVRPFRHPLKRVFNSRILSFSSLLNNVYKQTYLGVP